MLPINNQPNSGTLVIDISPESSNGNQMPISISSGSPQQPTTVITASSIANSSIIDVSPEQGNPTATSGLNNYNQTNYSVTVQNALNRLVKGLAQCVPILSNMQDQYSSYPLLFTETFRQYYTAPTTQAQCNYIINQLSSLIASGSGATDDDVVSLPNGNENCSVMDIVSGAKNLLSEYSILLPTLPIGSKQKILGNRISYDTNNVHLLPAKIQPNTNINQFQNTTQQPQQKQQSENTINVFEDFCRKNVNWIACGIGIAILAIITIVVIKRK